MRPLLDMDTIQIEVTNACVHECSNCTRLVGHSEKPFFISMAEFCAAVDSLVDYPKMVGMMGGEPLIHPQFEEMAAYLHSRIPRERCGLWSTLPKGKEHLAPLIAKVFGNVLLNDHTHGDIQHCPVLVAPADLGVDEFTMWHRIEHCPVQNSWSASITPKGGFFCEIAGALDMVLGGPGGWKVEPGWWKKTPKDYTAQMERYCRNCGAAFPLKPRMDTDGIDDLSESLLEKLKQRNSPKVRKGSYRVYDQGFVQEDAGINQFRRDNEYFQRIAARYGLGLRTNRMNYLEPYLLEGGDRQRDADAAMEAGNYSEAAALYAQDLEHDPQNITLLYNYATALSGLHRYDEAADLVCQALAIQPDNVECNLMLAFTRHNQNRHQEALHYYRLLDRRNAIIPLGNLAARVYFLAGRAALETGQITISREFFSKSLAIDPENVSARFARCLGGLGVPTSEIEAEEARIRFTSELNELVSLTKLDTTERIERAYQALGEAVHYYLAYQCKDDRDLQKQFGCFVCNVMAAKFPEMAKEKKPSLITGRRIKVGIVSAHFYLHSVWKIIVRGWLGYLDREKFSLHCYSLGEVHDAATEQARSLSDQFFESTDLPVMMDKIAEDQLDLIIYPGIGMDHRTQQLAALRLAPVQAVAWGHPVTTGMPTMDYFLSSDLMEPSGSERHYTEKLVRLPNLSVCYQPLETGMAKQPDNIIGTAGDEVLFLCCQNLLKYRPQHDLIYPRIALELPNARFVFINYSAAQSKILMKRLEQAFEQLGLVAEKHLQLVPKLNSADYNAVNAAADVYLDSIGWSGGNTTFESLPYNKPIVTLPGEFMRGRHTSAILTMMGVTETIASDVDDYVRIAVRLGSDVGWRKEISAKIAACKHKVYGDKACIHGLEQFIEAACCRVSA
jgi:predicted O-linked N-acetylglucosamine transferase (SPINDLY family)